MASLTLDKELEVKGEKKESKIVRTALELLRDFQEQREHKNSRIEESKDAYLRAMDGVRQSRLYTMPSYIFNQLVEIWATFVRVPDIQLKGFGINNILLIIMSKYLEKQVRDGGFYDLMTTKWSGFRSQALFGDFFVQMGYDNNDKRLGMPIYRGVGSGSISTQPTAEFISPYREGNRATRFGFTVSYNRGEMEYLFPGALNYAMPGDLPSLSEWENETSTKDYQQKNKDEYWQVLYFYDTRHRVYSRIIGSNAYEYKPLKNEAYPWKLKVRNKVKEIIPVSHFGMFASPEGIFYKGFGEVFFNIVDSLTQLNSGVINNAIDNRYAPAIVNIENSDAADVMQQIKMAKQRKERTGDNTYVVPTSITDSSGNVINPVGRQNLSYLKNETDFNEAQAIEGKFDEAIRRFGFNLSSFFNQQDTAKQSELDLEGQNQTIGKIQAQNLDAYRLVFDFALQSIIEFGDENDKTVFGNDIELPDGDKVSDLLKDIGIITVGDVVKMFKKHADNLEIEIDVSNGFVHNTLLERRSLRNLLEVTPQGTPAYDELLNSLALLEGKSVKALEAPAEQPIQPQVQAQQQLTPAV